MANLLQSNLEQIRVTYSPSFVPESQFQEMCNPVHDGIPAEHRAAPDPIRAEVNTVFQTVALWGVARMRQAKQGLATRELALVLTHLQEACDHMYRALSLDSTFKTDLANRKSE